MIYFLGQNITKDKAAYRSGKKCKKNRIQRIAKGIYIDEGDDLNTIVNLYATRIAAYLFPSSYFSGVSAYSVGKPDNNVIYMKGPQHKVVHIGNLTIFHARDFKNISEVDSFSFTDELGTSSFRKSGLRQLMLEAVEKVKDYPNGLNDQEIQEIFDFYISEFNPDEHDTAIEYLELFAKENNIEHLYKRLSTRIDMAAKERSPEAQAEFDLHWHNMRFAKLNYDGYAWRYRVVDGWILPMSIASNKGRSLPSFIEAILPETVLGKKGDADNAIDLLTQGKRYLSNLSIFEQNTDIDNRTVIEDIIQTQHAELDDGRGGYKQSETVDWDSLPTPDDMYEINVGIMNGHRDTPRLSGMQLKIPVSVSSRYGIASATDKPFTHLMKLPGRDTTAELPFREWLGMQGCAAGGARVANNLLVDLQENGYEAPGMICERFDIRESEDDTDYIMAEDFSSVLNVTSEMKYKKTLEDVANNLMRISTNPEEDAKEFMRMVVTGWLIGNGDLHIKNVCIIKKTKNPDDGWDSIRLAPAFDAVHTDGILHNGRRLTGNFSMPLNGKRADLTVDDFVSFGQKIKLSKQETINIIQTATSGIKKYCDMIFDNLPDFVLTDERLVSTATEFSRKTLKRCEAMESAPEKKKTKRFFKRG